MSDEPQQQDDIVAEVTTIVQQVADEFDALCASRHRAGAIEYGALTFLENDIVRMMLEELADTTNYCRMQGIKLMLLQARLEGELEKVSDDEGNITIGVQSFKGAGKGWNE